MKQEAYERACTAALKKICKPHSSAGCPANAHMLAVTWNHKQTIVEDTQYAAYESMWQHGRWMKTSDSLQQQAYERPGSASPKKNCKPHSPAGCHANETHAGCHMHADDGPHVKRASCHTTIHRHLTNCMEFFTCTLHTQGLTCWLSAQYTRKVSQSEEKWQLATM